MLRVRRLRYLKLVSPTLSHVFADLLKQEIALASDIQAYTLDVIAYGFLGDYATENIVAEIKRLLPVLSRALFSVPRGFPWPLNKVPILGFQHSMDARKEFQTLLAGVIRERRSDLTREMGTNKATKNCGLVDELLKLQKEQMDAGGPGEGGVILDDDFICDNVRHELDLIARQVFKFHSIILIVRFHDVWCPR